MAVSEKPGRGSGISIDSSLIKTTASGEVGSELSGLGVSVYSQEEFEAGVLQQIDKEVNLRISEQQLKFLAKDYRDVKTDISVVQAELAKLSRSIASLLSQPLCDVVLTLREHRASQELKRKQLHSLEQRQQLLLDQLSGKAPITPPSSSSTAGGGDSAASVSSSSSGGRAKDAAFSVPPSVGQESQRLIESGHLTPFGTHVDNESTAASSSTVVGPEKVSSTAATQSLMAAAVADQKKQSESQTPPSLKLSSDDFDGLFSNSVLPKRKPPAAKARTSSRRKSRDSTPTKQKPSSKYQEPSLSRSDDLDPNDDSMETGNAGNGDLGDAWVPTAADLEPEPHSSSSAESEYYTDDELGLEESGSKVTRKRKKKLRDLSSEDSDEDLDHMIRKKRRRGSRMANRYQDDGDEELYRLRMRSYAATGEGEEGGEADKVIDGRLRVPGSIWNRLYRYQRTCVQWLWELHCQQAGGVVGDEMGLGKTIEMIAFLAALKESNLRGHVTRKLGLGPVLIVCPATVMQQWVSEFHIWWAPFRVAVLHETGTFSGSKKALVDRTAKGDGGVLVTTYAGVRIYRELLLAVKWDYVVLDEGHKIRNPDAEVTLTCKQFATPHRVILSGSPMQNNLRELWSLFDFVFPGKLGTLPVFMEQFSVPITLGGYANATQIQVQTAYRCVCVLRDTINPYLLRRLKSDVKIELPSKNEQVLFCRLTDYQRELYQDFLRSPEVESMLSGRLHVFSGLMALRKLCNHPDLVTVDYNTVSTRGGSRSNGGGGGGGGVDSEEHIKIPSRANRKLPVTPSEEPSPPLLSDAAARLAPPEDEEVYGFWRRSGKMVVVESLLRLWQTQGHRVLLFSQSAMMLDILERFLRSCGYSYRRMDGTTAIAARQPLVDTFNSDASIFVFLLTTRVGGIGVNLTGANRVVIYDPDWNPSTDVQARERAWRIGQTRPVTIYRLLTSGTIEEKIYHRQIFKQFLTNRVLKDPRQRRFFKSNNLHELFTLGASEEGGGGGGGTETSAIFAGTGSEVRPRVRQRLRLHDHSGKGGSSSEKFDSSGMEPGPSGVELESVEHGMEPGPSGVKNGMEPAAQREPTAVKKKHKKGHRSRKSRGKEKMRERPEKKKKKQRRKKRPNASLDGAEITGLEGADSYEPGEEEEGGRGSSQQDDYILRKLFKKSGVHSALQHDTIMSSANPDYILVESEADKVARSAARALKASRRHCTTATTSWGRPTWTGQHGVAGAPRFGVREQSAGKVKAAGSLPAATPHFSGREVGSSLQQTPSSSSSSSSSSSQAAAAAAAGSLNTSSGVLLARMKSRNAHTLPAPADGLHLDNHRALVREVRDFIATQCREDGQAKTAELLGKFAEHLPHSDTALFRSMLYEICDFSRKDGDGVWTLKAEFR